MSFPLDSYSKRDVREANSSQWRVTSQQSTIKKENNNNNYQDGGANVRKVYAF